jgi:ankyrin repeat protein
LVHECAASGHAELADMLLDLEVPYINVANRDGDTPLHLAVKNNHADVAASLIRKGASILVKNSAGRSPVDLLTHDEKNIFAVKHPELIKLLNSRKPKTKTTEEEDIGCQVF